MKKILLSLFFLGLSAHELEELERINMHGQHTIAANKTILKTILAKHGNKADYLLSRWLRNGCFETTNNRSMIPSNLHRVCKEQIVEDGELSTDRFFKYIAIGNRLYGGNINGTLRNIRANIERNSAIFENQLEDLPAINSLDPTNMIINLQCFTVSPQGNFIASNAIVNEDGALDNYAITFEETDESDVLEEEAFWHEDISSHSSGTLISEDNKTLVFNPSRPDCFITSEYWGNHKRYVNQEILALGKKKIWLKDGDHLLLTKILPHGEETFWFGWPILPKLEGDSEAATNLLIFNRMRPEDSYGNLLEIEKIAHDIKANILLMLTTNSYTGDKEIMLYQAYGELAFPLQSFFTAGQLENINHISLSGNGMVASVSFKEGAHQVVRNIDIPNNKFSDFKLGINEEVKKICLDMDGNELLIHGKKADNRNFIVKTKLNI